LTLALPASYIAVMEQRVLFSIITPSRGDRPEALGNAVASVERAVTRAGELLPVGSVEVLVGFDGVKGQRVAAPEWVRFFDLPKDGDFGNAIRDKLLKAARGERVLFLDDDNALTEEALVVYLTHPVAEMVIGRIDTSRAFDKPFLPELVEGREVVRQTNIDPLCLCLSRDLVVNRCRGWSSKGGYEADFVNMVKYSRRARSVETVKDVVGVYDAGAGLDQGGGQLPASGTLITYDC
jgi:hypothetical protein